MEASSSDISVQSSFTDFTDTSRNVKSLIKLKVNESETVRRIPVHRISVKESEVSFEKLHDYALRYSTYKDEVTVKITYRDDEGDVVEISTSEELQDAIALSTTTLQLHASVLLKKKPVHRKLEQRSYEVLNVVGSVLNFVCDTVDVITSGLIPYPASKRTSKFDPNFIHNRHTCDGCGVSPIVGYRWHAVNIRNYDLCHKCKFTKKDGHILFQMAQIESDRNEKLIRNLIQKNILARNKETQTPELDSKEEVASKRDCIVAVDNSVNTDIVSLSHALQESGENDDVSTKTQTVLSALEETPGSLEKEHKEDDEWAMVGKDETGFEAIGSSLFRKGLME